MARINLLPWREERRRERKQQFLLNAGIAAVCAVAAIGLVHVVYQNIIDYQTARNGYLESEIKKLDKTIAEIRDLEKEKQRLIDRMRAIETLQTSRPIIVHIFDELVSTLPEGISLTEITSRATRSRSRGLRRGYRTSCATSRHPSGLKSLSSTSSKPRMKRGGASTTLHSSSNK